MTAKKLKRTSKEITTREKLLITLIIFCLATMVGLGIYLIVTGKWEASIPIFMLAGGGIWWIIFEILGDK